MDNAQPLDWKERFYSACAHWVSTLGLTEWRVQFHEFHEPDEAYARVVPEFESCLCSFGWNTAGSDLGDMKSPEQIAKHEVLHVLLHRLICVAAETRKPFGSIVNSEEHCVIQRLLGVL